MHWSDRAPMTTGALPPEAVEGRRQMEEQRRELAAKRVHRAEGFRDWGTEFRARPGANTYKARCSCGWQSSRAYPDYEAAQAAADRHASSASATWAQDYSDDDEYGPVVSRPDPKIVLLRDLTRNVRRYLQHQGEISVELVETIEKFLRDQGFDHD